MHIPCSPYRRDEAFRSTPLVIQEQMTSLANLGVLSDMQINSKIVRAGNDKRKTRFHTLRGDLIPMREIATVPIELFLRLIGCQRRGPWLSKSAVKEISRLLADGRHKRVLEIGGGRSTFFFSKRVSFLMTVEEDSEWAAHIRQKISKKDDKFQLVNVKLDEWLNSRTKENMDFDIVLIDGGSDIARKKALEILPILNPEAVYILDNSDREIFYQVKYFSQPKKVIRYSGLIRHPFQATETTFYFF